jgi:dihydrolipoamide dehydrogenase
MSYDLIILGGGPAGYLAGERAGRAGLKALVIEKRNLGGVCLNEGCIPSKTLLHSAKLYDYSRYSEKYGVKTEKASLDHAAVIKRKNKVVKTLTAGIRAQLKGSRVDVKEGVGTIVSRSGDGFEVEVNGERATGRRLLIATGSMPVVPPLPGLKEGLESGFVLTNREILDLTEVPESLVIVGGGVIGLEMASYFNSAGSRVTIIEMLDHIAGNTDTEIGKILMKNYVKKGIEFNLNSKVTQIKAGSVVFEKDGKTNEIPASKVLLSIGRRPVVDGFGLENIGVRVERGRIEVDEFLRTNIPGVYAAGDVTGKSLLAHTAYRQAEVAVNHMLGKRDIMRYNTIPSVIYTNPEVASIGETEESAREKGIDFVTANISMRYSGRYLAENEDGDGICKILVDKKFKKLIGVHMIGSYASEMIFGAGVMMETEMRIDDIKEVIFPHPTVCEIIREGIFSLDL